MRILNTLGIILLVFSYPITTVWLIEFGQQSSTANALIKGFIAAIFAAALLFRGSGSIDGFKPAIPLLIFLLLYSIRMLYDVLVLDILYAYQSKFYTLSYALGLTLLPTLAAALCLQQDSLERLHRWIFTGAIIANLSLLYYVLSIGGLAQETAFSGRLQIEGEIEGSTVLNPILVGAMGAVLAAFTMGRLAVMRNNSPLFQLGHGALIGLGGVNLLLGASRGPALAFAICFLILIFSLFRSHAGFGALKFQKNLWVYAGLMVVGLVYLITSDVLSISLFDRFTDMFDDRTGRAIEERDIIYAMAWQDFLSAPVIGYSYVVTGGYLPHNIVLEALVSTGVLGALFLLLTLYWAVRGTWNLLNGTAGPLGYPIALAAICFFVIGMVSGSVGQYPEFWIFLTIVIVLGNRRTAESFRARPMRLALSRSALPQQAPFRNAGR